MTLDLLDMRSEGRVCMYKTATLPCVSKLTRSPRIKPTDELSAAAMLAAK